MMRPPVVARWLSAGLLIGGWIVLGALGQRHAPLWAGGLLPLVVWLAAAGGLVHAAGGRRVSAAKLQALAAAAGVGTGTALAAVVVGGGPFALGMAAACWGLCVGAALVLWDRASLYGQGGLAGLMDCALPLSLPEGWRRPSAWGLLAARSSMLPMMATLSLTGGWCGAAGGWSSADWMALHLLAMLVPACLVAALGVHLDDAAWASAAMVAAGLALMCAPGLQGLMIASCLQAVAWGIAGATRRRVPPASTRIDERRGAWQAWCPALLVLGLGVGTDHGGPSALGAVQATLSLFAAAGLIVRAPGLLHRARQRRRWAGAGSG